MFASKARNGKRAHRVVLKFISLLTELCWNTALRGEDPSSRIPTSQPPLRKKMLLDYWFWRICAYYSPLSFSSSFQFIKQGSHFTVTFYVCHIGNTVTFNLKKESKHATLQNPVSHTIWERSNRVSSV